MFGLAPPYLHIENTLTADDLDFLRDACERHLAKNAFLVADCSINLSSQHAYAATWSVGRGSGSRSCEIVRPYIREVARSLLFLSCFKRTRFDKSYWRAQLLIPAPRVGASALSQWATRLNQPRQWTAAVPYKPTDKTEDREASETGGSAHLR